ncbi:agarase [Paraglaciecola hydrolytica]|uniref:Agarase n=2 Tax=Paraglaciecola hydrolytica TaxID=1799789 RepID=A0A136A0U4_9ALTE|nr:agarase [Paraglaciecola hydrolytica]
MPTLITTHQLNRLLILSLSFAVIACGGSGGSATPPSTPPPVTTPVTDTTPNSFSFSFSSIDHVPLDTLVSSDAISISGINAATAISISGGEFKVNEGEFTASSTTLNNNDKVTVRITSAADYATSSELNVTIGGVVGSFKVTTVPAPPLGKVVDVNLDIKHSVGGIERFDREKFITIHANHTENDWYAVGENASADLITEFAEGYDVYFGRDAGGIGWNLNNLPQDPAKAGFVDPAATTERANGVRWNYTNLTTPRAITQRNLEYRNKNLIVSGQQHPYWPDGQLTGNLSAASWAFSQIDSANEPFGTATGDYMARYVSQFFKQGETDPYGQTKPAFVEVMNEPLYDLYDAATNPVELSQVFAFHKTVANTIRNLEINGEKPNQNLKVGGYTAAFPDFDTDNFQEWEERDKLFIDMAGADMDFISLHLYDMPRFRNTVQLRKGSNMEATFDLLEHYTNLSFGAPKPFIISEYGSQVHTMLNSPWSPERDWLFINSMNAQLMNFLERPNLIEMTIPFIVVKAEWGRISDTVPYSHRLMRQQKEAAGETGDLWVYTDLVKFYQLWANVNGQRAESKANDLDLQVDAYVDGNKAYIIVNSLEMEATTFSLNTYGLTDNDINQLIKRELRQENGVAVLDEQTLTSIPNTMEIGAEATIIFEITYQNAIAMAHSATETKYYASTYKQAIVAATTHSFTIADVILTDEGEAVLRLGLGRDHGLSLLPTVTFNDVTLSVPEDFRGYDQFYNGNGRENFFGVIEIPVPLSALQATNTINVTFDDAGGFISSLSLQVLNSDKALKRAE